MFLLLLVGAFILFGFSPPAEAMELGIQDQGADPAVVQRTAQDLGATSVRIVVTTEDPQIELVERYRSLGLKVQAAIVVKKTTTPARVMATVRAWRGMVRTISVGNEPELNGVPACTYARLFARTAPALRRQGIRVGFGEFSPVRAIEYVREVSRCHERIRADFTAVHPYQFFSDPLGSPTEKSGLGTWLGLGNLGGFARALRRGGLPRRLRATEFSYLVDGRYKVTMAKATAMWPRAIKQARKHVEQFNLYGLGVVPAGTWGSAALLDAHGRRTPAYLAIAKALGRTLRPEHVQVPPPPITGLLPDGTTEHWPAPLDVRPIDVDPPKGEGASKDPVPEEPPTDAPEAPVVDDEPTPAEPDPLDNEGEERPSAPLPMTQTPEA
jgi:hypothetical protein